jgi:hypothetical protein
LLLMTVRAAVGAVVLVGAVGACGGSVDSDGHPSGSDHAGGSHTKETGGTGYGGEAGSTEEPLVPSCPAWEGLDICGAESFGYMHFQTTFLLVVDRSASMLGPLPGQTRSKWEVVREELSSVLEAASPRSIRDCCTLGLELFPSSASSEPIPLACAGPPSRCCELPGGSEMNIDIDPEVDTVPLITNALAAAAPAGATPTARALARAYDYLTIGAGAALPSKYVLLVTDGGPNCNDALSCEATTCTLSLNPSEGCVSSDPNCCASTPGGCLDDQATAEQIERLASSFIPTIVIGVPDNELYADTLAQLASSSSYQRDRGDTPYFDLSIEGESEALSDSLPELVPQVLTTCEFWSDQLPTDPAAVQVAADCNVIPPGEPDGEGSRWYFDNPENPTTIIYDGPICERRQTGSVERIDVIFACPDSTW